MRRRLCVTTDTTGRPTGRTSGRTCRCNPWGGLEFYAACREPGLAVCVATGDNRLYANVLLTVGYLPPPS